MVDSTAVQCFTYLIVQLLFAAYVAHVAPYVFEGKQRLAIVDCIFLLINGTSLFLFMDLLPDNESNYMAGWLQVSLIVAVVLYCLV